MPFNKRSHHYRVPPKPREIKQPPAPPRAPKKCRYHTSSPATAVVYATNGWVLLCTACGNAVRNKGLIILDGNGLYEGYVPLLPNTTDPLQA